ncbi:MAG: ABC transporter ATP-binding protein [Methanocella sp.]
MVGVIEVHGLVKTYGKVRALNGFDLSVRKNTVHALVGPNGSGKSTAVKVLAGEVKPDTGSAIINGLSVSSPELKGMVARVPDICRIPDNQTPRTLLWKHGKACRLAREDITYRADVLAGMLEIAPFMDTKIGELSRGMKRRVSIAMGLFTDASVILMDGSLSELDPIFCATLINNLRSTGDKTILLTSNNMDMLDRICDGVTIIKEGATLLNESMTSVREKIGRPAITLRVSPLSQARLVQSINQQLFVNHTYAGEGIVTVEVDDIIHIPGVIRHASAFTEIYEARQTMTSLEDLYRSFFEEPQ